MSINFDAASYGTTGSATLTVAHTCTGQNLILLVSLAFNGGSPGYSCTYNGVSMTQIDFGTTSNESYASFYLLNPGTGNHNIVASCGTGGSFSLAAASYTGVNSISQPDNHNATYSQGGGTSLTGTLTTIADNCWVILCAGVNTNGMSASTGATLRAVGNQVSCTAGLFDNNAAKTPAGSVSETVTFSSGRYGYSIISIKPPMFATASDTQASVDISSLFRTWFATCAEILHVFEIQYIKATDSVTTTDISAKLRGIWTNLKKDISSWINQIKN